MSDLVDRAQELEQIERDASLAAVALRPMIVGRVCCMNCGAAISPLRTAIGAQRCIECQQADEARQAVAHGRGGHR